jgi:hypothetical protein
MNDNYLWDGSGEPDPELKRLEELLRPLGHCSPEPEWPARPRRAFWPVVAAAAAIVLAALGGLWMSRHSSNNVVPQPSQVAERKKEDAQKSKDSPAAQPKDSKESLQPQQAISPKPHRRNHRRPSGHSHSELARADEQLRIEGERAKAKLLLALHIASSKLNEVQKRVQQSGDHKPHS